MTYTNYYELSQDLFHKINMLKGENSILRRELRKREIPIPDMSDDDIKKAAENADEELRQDKKRKTETKAKEAIEYCAQKMETNGEFERARILRERYRL